MKREGKKTIWFQKEMVERKGYLIRYGIFIAKIIVPSKLQPDLQLHLTWLRSWLPVLCGQAVSGGEIKVVGLYESINPPLITLYVNKLWQNKKI